MAGWVGVGVCFVTCASLALTMASQFLHINSGWYPTFIFLGLESLSILGLVRVTSWCILAGVALGLAFGLAWYDLLAKGLAMV